MLERMKKRRLFRSVRVYIVVAAVLATAGALVFAIYFTQSSLQWVAFLTGILVAAILAEAVQVSRSEWVVMRRTAQLSALKEKFEREIRRRHDVEQKIADSRPRLELLDDALQTMVLLVGTDGHCRYHNRAFREWLNLNPELIDGRHIREIFGSKAFTEIATAVRQSLDGQAIHYEWSLQMPGNVVYRLAMRHVPQFDNAGKVTGFFILANDVTQRGDVSGDAGTATLARQISAAAGGEPDWNTLYQDALKEKDIAKRIIAAVQKGEFHLYCQLISPLPLGSGGSEHYEILIRLFEEEESMLPPGAFFELAEKHGLMPYLDRWVVQHVLEWAARNKQLNPNAGTSIYFINVASATIGDPEFGEFLKTALEDSAVNGSVLCFEVPETELVKRHESALRFIQSIHECGCRVALSGFGREEAPFNLLRGFQVQFLKIDGSIILGVTRDEATLKRVMLINQIARKIGVKTVAELVESEELIARLSAIGINYAQGFGISQPRALGE
jgi:PAS domain S-box-containing protein